MDLAIPTRFPDCRDDDTWRDSIRSREFRCLRQRGSTRGGALGRHAFVELLLERKRVRLLVGVRLAVRRRAWSGHIARHCNRRGQAFGERLLAFRR